MDTKQTTKDSVYSTLAKMMATGAPRIRDAAQTAANAEATTNEINKPKESTSEAIRTI